MSDLQTLRRVALAGVLLAVVLGGASTALIFASVGDFEAFTFGHVDTILRAGPQAAPLWRWAMLTDMLFSYLLLAPLALYGHRLLRERKPWLADLGLFGALAYITLGAASAASLAIAGSSLIESYGAASPEQQVAIVTSFTLLRDVFYYAIWQTVDAITLGTWLFASGWLLLSDRPRLGRLLVVLGGGTWSGGLMTMVGVHSLAVVALIFGAALGLWLLWLVVYARRGPGQPMDAVRGPA